MPTRLTKGQLGQAIKPSAVTAAPGQTAARAGKHDASNGRGNPHDSVRDRNRAAHRDTGGKLSETARRLGVSRHTIYRAIAVS